MPDDKLDIKAPVEGSKEGQYKLPEWKKMMLRYLQIKKLHTVLNLPDDHNYTDAQQAKDAEAFYIILSNLSMIDRCSRMSLSTPVLGS